MDNLVIVSRRVGQPANGRLQRKLSPTLGQKRPSYRNFNAGDKETGPRNPQIQALINEIINDNGEDIDGNIAEVLTLLSNETEFITYTTSNFAVRYFCISFEKSVVPPRKPSAEDIAEIFPSEPPRHVVDDVFPQVVGSKLRTKEDIVRFSDGEDNEHSDTDESIDIADIKPNVKFLPATVDMD